MKKKLIISTLLFLFVSAHAENTINTEIKTKKEVIKHTIEKNDNLWDISKTYLDNPYLWNHIEDNNKINYQNLEIGKEIIINKDWKKLKPSTFIPSNTKDISTLKNGSYSRYLMDHILYDVIILDSDNKHEKIIASERKQDDINISDNFYIHNDGNLKLNDTYTVYRHNRKIENLGLEYSEIGEAIIIKFIDNLALLKTIKTKTILNKGNVLIKKNKKDHSFLKQVSKIDLKEKLNILSIVDNKEEALLFDYIILEPNNNIKEGNVLSIYSKSEIIVDKETNQKSIIPPEKKANIIIVKKNKDFIVGMISKSLKPIKINDYAN
jgi:hypothetical protein